MARRGRPKFGEAARYCSEKVRYLPPGERRKAFLECMSVYASD